MKWGDKRFYSADFFYKNKFGSKVSKINIDGGFSCPNRDGKISTKGCLFCSPAGSGDFCMDKAQSITKQIKGIKEKIKNKWGEPLIIPYFQAFTNTYAPVDVLRSKYYEALQYPDVVGLSIATRPDCIDDDVFTLLDEISDKTYLQVELGLQTINQKSLADMNIGYKLDTFEKTVMRLKKINIDITVHIIIGLPGDSFIDYENIINYLSYLGINGIKIQMLQILKGTRLGDIYKEKHFPLMNLCEYTDTVVHLLTIMNPEIVVHRLSGDPPWSIAAAPDWITDKRRVLNTINKKLEDDKLYQGVYYRLSP